MLSRVAGNLCVLLSGLDAKKKRNKKKNSFSIPFRGKKKTKRLVAMSFLLSSFLSQLRFFVFPTFAFCISLDRTPPPRMVGEQTGVVLLCVVCPYSSTSCIVLVHHPGARRRRRARMLVLRLSSFFIMMVHRNIVLAPFQKGGGLCKKTRKI